jgi:hypothetical protein
LTVRDRRVFQANELGQQFAAVTAFPVAAATTALAACTLVRSAAADTDFSPGTDGERASADDDESDLGMKGVGTILDQTMESQDPVNEDVVYGPKQPC